MKKVVVQILRTPAGGIRKHVYDILAGLPADEFEHIFITNMKDADRPVPSAQNISVHHLDIGESPSPKDLINFFKIYCLLYGKNVDVVHGHGAKGGLYARIVAYFLRAKCIYTPHGGSLHRVHGRIKNFLYDCIELFLIPFTDVFLFESRYSRDIFFQNVLDVGSKAVVNYNGVELPSETSTTVYKAGNPLRLASFGLLRNLKGHDIAIKACALLQKENIPFSYSIYGEGEERDNLEGLIHQHQLEGKISILAYSGNVPEEMRKYDFVLHPSRFESFGYVPVEAMSVNVPVIASQEGGLREVLDPESGFISGTNSPDEYAWILRSLYEGELHVGTKIEHARERVLKNFTRQRMLGLIAEIYCF